MKTMTHLTWDARSTVRETHDRSTHASSTHDSSPHHRRTDGRVTRLSVLRDVVEEANHRRDGALPTDVPGVDETFADDFALVTALQLRWHTRLAGRIERSLMDEPADLASAVLRAWRTTADELVGVRAILDAYAASPTSSAMGDALSAAHRRDLVLMAVMAGLASGADARAVRVGQGLEDQARIAYHPAAAPGSEADHGRHASLLERLRALLVA